MRFALPTMLLLLALTFTSCTDDAEQTKMLMQQRRIEELEKREQAIKEAKALEAPPAPVVQEEVQPEQPAEPEQVKLFLVFHTKCQCIFLRDCGVSAWGCTNGTSYDCMHDVSYTVVQETKTDANSSEGNCESN